MARLIVVGLLLLHAASIGAQPPTTSAGPPATAKSAARQAELAKWDDPSRFLPPSGPGGTAWDAQYRSFIQTDSNAVSKGFPTHAVATAQIVAVSAKSASDLQLHKSWVLFIKHFSQAYRPEPATADLKKLYEKLVALEFGDTLAVPPPSRHDARLRMYRHVADGRSAAIINRDHTSCR